jgi:DNA-binding CsgD family transcriptional regulator
LVPQDEKARLVGRRDELATLAAVAESAASGRSGVLVLSGDPGIGKTALLDDLAESPHGLVVVRLNGTETEANLPFAAVQRLVALTGTDDAGLPAPQRDALRVAIGVAAGAAPDRFLVGLAVHSLLVQTAARHPLLVAIDDLQWLDQESIDALAFAARRLQSDGVAMIVGRRSELEVPAFAGFPELRVAGLDPAGALALLRRVVIRRLDPRISDQIVTATAGNPLAIIDLAQELSTHQLVGLTLLPEPLPIGSHLEAHYLRQLQALPTDVQTWLLLAAAEPSGDTAYVATAAAVLGIDVYAGDLAEARDLVRVRNRIEFRHPLVRSAIYGGATGAQRRRVHGALGAVTRRERDLDRRIWHLAAATTGPDEDVAALVEASADRARVRGGYSATANLLARAVELSPEGPHRVRRSVMAAESALMAGRPETTLALLDGIDPALLDDISRGRSLMARASAQAFSGAPGAMASIPAICTAAAAAFENDAPDLARQAAISAFERAMSAECLMTGVSVADIADQARRVVGPQENSLQSLVLQALVELATRPFAQAGPTLRTAVDALCADDVPDDDLTGLAWASVALTTALWDDGARDEILRRAADLARRTGAVQLLDSLLFILSVAETVLGQLDSAAAHLAELGQVRDALGMSAAQQEMFRNVEYLAWRGDDDQLEASIDMARQVSIALGMGGVLTMANTASMLVHLCNGHYEQAYRIARANRDLNFLQISIRVLPDLIESAARSGRAEEALVALRELREVAQTSGTPWGLGVLERSAAVLAEQADPEPHYVAAIEHLSGCRARADLARSHLLYGEWLRRQKRRRDARVQLHAAVEHFQGMGAALFAARAQRELAATGEHPEAAAGGTQLTTQELAVARLAAQGATNSEIAGALVVSRHTVDYHLRKIYRKLSITSRRELAHRAAEFDPQPS